MEDVNLSPQQEKIQTSTQEKLLSTKRKIRIPFRISLVMFYFIFPFLELLIWFLFFKESFKAFFVEPANLMSNTPYTIPVISWNLIVMQFLILGFTLSSLSGGQFSHFSFIIINFLLFIVIYPLIVFKIGSIIDKKLKLRSDRKLASIS